MDGNTVIGLIGDEICNVLRDRPWLGENLKSHTPSLPQIIVRLAVGVVSSKYITYSWLLCPQRAGELKCFSIPSPKKGINNFVMVECSDRSIFLIQ